MSPTNPFRNLPTQWLGRLRRRVGPMGRGLWHAVAGGPDEPAPIPLLRRGRRLTWRQVLVLGIVMMLAGAVVLGAQLSTLHLLMGGPWWPIVMVLSVALLLVMVRRPLLAWRIAWLALLYELTLLGTAEATAPDSATMTFVSWLPDWFPPLFVSEIQVAVFLVVLFVAAASQPLRVVCWVWVLTTVLVWLIPLGWSLDFVIVIERLMWFTDPYRQTALPDSLAVQLGGAVLVTAVVLAGQLTRRQYRTRRQLAESEEQGLVLAERARIARELHDVVAHHMSMIAVRAETAPYRLGAVEPAARDEFQEISRESRTALTEMRRLLGVLRSDEPAAPTTPQPGLTDLADLLDAARSAGASVTVEMHGAMSGLPAAVDVCAYRIVQEALTNAARHAVGAPVHVTLRRTSTELSLSIRNGPGEQPPAPHAATGHGVRGMRERAAMLGGTLHAGPAGDGGGFEVAATLPLAGDGVEGGAEGGIEDDSGNGDGS